MKKYSQISPRFVSVRFIPPHRRLFLLFLWGIAVSAIHHPIWLAGLNIVVVLAFAFLLLSSRKPRLIYLKRLAFFHLFTLFLWATLSWKIGTSGIEFNPKGISLALLISLRMNLLLFSTWLALWKISDAILVQAISQLPLPQKLIQLFILTVRYIRLLGELNQKMDMAMKARGFQAKANRRTLAVISQRVALLLIHALNRVERSEMALKARGFHFQPTTSKLNSPYWKYIELLVVVLLVVWLYLIN